MSHIRQTLIQFSTMIDAINEWIGNTVAWFTLLMVIVTFAVVVLRYVFNVGWIAMQESVIYFHACVFMLGAAYTLKRNDHVRVDIFYQNFSPQGKAWVDLLGTLFFLLPVCGFIFWMSIDYVSDAWEVHEASREAGGLPGVYLLKTTILLMASLLILQGIASILRSLFTLLPPSVSSTQ